MKPVIWNRWAGWGWAPEIQTKQHVEVRQEGGWKNMVIKGAKVVLKGEEQAQNYRW